MQSAIGDLVQALAITSHFPPPTDQNGIRFFLRLLIARFSLSMANLVKRSFMCIVMYLVSSHCLTDMPHFLSNMEQKHSAAFMRTSRLQKPVHIELGESQRHWVDGPD
tara:strand:- start:1838 stop:2161 length:324 start_codon:yes stop_codon:yes gene_type:complete